MDLSYRDTTVTFNDYSFATPYIDFKTKQHLEPKKIGSIHGEMLFMSLNKLKFKSISRRDDMIGLAHIIIYLLNG